MSDDGTGKRPRLGRRGFLRAAGATTGAIALAAAIPGARARQLPSFTVTAAAFEQEVGVSIPSDVVAPAEIALVLRDPGGERVLDFKRARPGETVTVRLAYPYRSLVPGDYAYVARVRDAHGGTRASEPLVVTLTRYRFGC